MLLHLKESDRLRFRNITHNDFASWMDFVKDPEAIKYFGNIGDPDEFCRGWIDRQLNRYAEHGHGMYVLTHKTTGEFVGQCGLMIQEVEGKRFLEVGYHLFTRYRKKGFASEAARFCRDFGFENKLDQKEGIEKGVIVSLIHPQNQNSQAVAKRNGMTAGMLSTWKDLPHIIFSISRKEWELLAP